ncbi:unnamed protein product [Vitrella brassicaformis CCMP3155]|uniref:Uncharacterized protein n=2 Tax=Vitrella brassicaformis TaxID=1169539 RepID=A0A0G4EK18_VITBC|nr:unnamed protein product [Vitrella brassicaformis CCMP3155]|eukprot:CEL96888.1 unnamed protein product [Vitrella brassicaformis CCMP3155]
MYACVPSAGLRELTVRLSTASPAEQRAFILDLFTRVADMSTQQQHRAKAAVQLGSIIENHLCSEVVDEVFDEQASTGSLHHFLSSVLALLPPPPHGSETDTSWPQHFSATCFVACAALRSANAQKGPSVRGLHAHLLTHSRDALDLIEEATSSSEAMVRSVAVQVLQAFVQDLEPAAGLVSLRLSGFYHLSQCIFGALENGLSLPLRMHMLMVHCGAVEPYIKCVLGTEPTSEAVHAVLRALQKHCFPHVATLVNTALSSTAPATTQWAAWMILGCISIYVYMLLTAGCASPDVQSSVLEACGPFVDEVTQPAFLGAVVKALNSRSNRVSGFSQNLQLTLVTNIPLLSFCAVDKAGVIESGLSAALAALMTDDGVMRDSHGPLAALHLTAAAVGVVDHWPKVAAAEGFATAVCRMLLGLLRGRRDPGDDTIEGDVVNNVCKTLKRLVSYGDDVMERRGETQNHIARQILQEGSVKTMRDENTAKRLNVPKQILDLFDRIEKAETDRYEKAIEAEFDDTPSTAPTPANTAATTKKGKKAGSKKKKGKGKGKTRPGGANTSSGLSPVAPVDHDGCDASERVETVAAKEETSEGEHPAKSTPDKSDGQPSVPSTVVCAEGIDDDDQFITVTHRKKANKTKTPTQQQQQQLFAPSASSPSSASRPSPPLLSVPKGTNRSAARISVNLPPYKPNAAASGSMSGSYRCGAGHEGSSSASAAGASLSDIMTTATSTKQHSRVPSFETLPSRRFGDPFPPLLPTHHAPEDNDDTISLPPRPSHPPPRHTHGNQSPHTALPAAGGGAASLASPLYGNGSPAAGPFPVAVDGDVGYGDVGSPLPPAIFPMFDSDENDTAAPPHPQTHPAGDSDISSGGAYQGDSGSSSFRDLQLRLEWEMEAMRQRQEREMDEMRQRLAALSAGHQQQQQPSSSSTSVPPPPTQHPQHQHQGGECSVCAPASVMYMPCRHLRVCPKCYDDNKARVARELTKVRAENDRRKRENEERIRQNEGRGKNKQLSMVKLLDEPHYVCEHCNGRVEFGGSVEEVMQWVANNPLT